MLLLISWAAVLCATETDREASAARKRKFAVARVVDVQEDDGEAQDWTEGRRIGQQQLEVEILTGEWKGVRLETINYLTIYTNVDAREGTRIIVRLDVDDDGQPYVVSVPNYDRAPVLAGLALVFAALLVVIGRKKGLMALAGLLYTLACIWFIQVPMILRGADPVWITILIVVLTTGASLLLLTGISKKTLCATLGCVGGVAAAGLFAALFCVISPLNGFNMSEAEELVLRSLDRDIHISGLFVSGILIASLGAVMDVAMSIASSMAEVQAQTPDISCRALFQAGMRVGRDMMGTDSNTLILAFAGGSVSMLVLDYAYDLSWLQIINSNNIGIAIMQGLADSFGVVLSVPVTVALAMLLYVRPDRETPALQEQEQEQA